MDFSNLPLLPTFLLLAGLVLAFWDRFNIPSSTSFERETAYNKLANDVDAVPAEPRRRVPDYVEARTVDQRPSVAAY